MKARALLALAALAALANAEMSAPTLVPGARVIKNLTAQIKAKPDSADLHYLLGRVHYALFCFPEEKGSVRLYGTETSPAFPRNHPGPQDFTNRQARTGESIDHIRTAIQELQTALKLGGNPGLYHLTLACAYEASSPVAEKVEKGVKSKAFLDRALIHYVASFQASKSADKKQPYRSQPMTYDSWISVESAQSVLRLVPDHPLRTQIQDHLAYMAKLPNGPITPLIFSLTDAKPLDSLLDPFSIVHFDLDGTGQPQTYQWVRRDTAFLVWQPDPRVPIRSGRQLFGSATWWLMNRDAYSAMSLLDDDRNGWLTGRELLGLGVWRDANQNGVSESGEVLPAVQVGIDGLRTLATGRVGESWVSTAGLRMRDGRTLPTYDWVTRSIE